MYYVAPRGDRALICKFLKRNKMMRQIKPGPLVQKLFAMRLRVSRSFRPFDHFPAFPHSFHDSDWQHRDVERYRDV